MFQSSLTVRLMILAGVATTALVALAAPAAAQTATQITAPLISRQALFGNPVRAGGQLSPDGRWVSWLAPQGGVMNVWVAPLANPAAAKAVTASTDRPIRQYYWSPDSKAVLYIQDKGGDENFLLYAVDPVTGAERNLTPFTKTRVELLGASTLYKDRVLVGLNNRDARWHDVYSLNLATGKLDLMMNGDGYAGFVADNNLKLRMALRPNPAGGIDYYAITDGKVAAKPFATTTLADSQTTNPAGYTTDGTTLYWVDSRGRNTAALVAQDVATGKTTIVAQDPRADIGGTLVNPKTGRVEAYSVEYLRTDWTVVDPALKPAFAFLKRKISGDFRVVSRTDADDKWLVGASSATEPARTYLYDRKAGTLTQLYASRPDLANAPLQEMHPVSITTRDGKTLVSYLTLPPGSDVNGDGVPDHPVPMVLFVHGGPWARDSYGYNSYHQWMANRGYAVLSPNFRGSTGLGKDFISAGDLQWGRAMHDDLLDAVSWAVSKGVTSADKVGIMGGSYGGYATLAAMAFTPTKFACGVDIVGPSNLETLLKTIPPYWTAGIEQFHQRMGNPNTPEGLALLKERSPLYKAGDIVHPLLIGQGANDPRVNKAESDQIANAMKARNIPVSYVLFPDEGHGFAKPANNIAFNAVAENFLAGCLGGRAEPIGEALRKSTGQVIEGAGNVPGLAQAMTR